MIEKIILSDQDYEYLTKGIAIGVGIGTLVGLGFCIVIELLISNKSILV